mmetsp:Transcript_10187/g.12911  ORF Transcript_10187/g.12911 Transcript_10187/m.12911 type:complete len:113 (+) Transcript_10187:86-424(+)
MHMMKKLDQSDDIRTPTSTPIRSRTQVFEFLSPCSTNSSRSIDSSDVDPSSPKCIKRTMIDIHPLSPFASMAAVEDEQSQRQHDKAKYCSKSAQGLEVVLNLDNSLSYEESD